MNKRVLNPTLTIIEHIFVNVQFIDNSFELYINNLQNEIKKTKQKFNFKVKSIYLAGDDILTLTINQFTSLLSLLNIFNNENLIEYSIECSYYKIDDIKFELLKTFGINRLVWKVMTFQQKLLNKVNDNYQVETMINNIKRANTLGFTNFSIDLKYNLLKQKAIDITFDLEQVLNLNVPHISFDSYDETENKTNRMVVNEVLSKAKYDNYEVFSYSKQDINQSQQTLAYLNLKNWFGFGPNASSFLKINNKQILTITNDDQWKSTTTMLSNEEYYQLILTQGLMLKKGIELGNDNLKAVDYYQNIIKDLSNQQLLQIDNNTLKTTKAGWILLNKILTVIIYNKQFN